MVGLLVGFMTVAAVWLLAFSAALSGSRAGGIPFIVTTGESGGDVEATTGPGAILVPLALCVVGAIAGILIATAIRRRGAHDAHPR